MGRLLIRLFGGLSVELDGERLSTGMGRNVGGLLAYLALHHSQLHHREAVAEVFWPDVDPDLARRCLNTALWRLRRLIEPHAVRRGTHLVSTAQGEIGLKNSGVLWVDIAEFESIIQNGIANDGRLAAEDDRTLSSAL
jgi:DNA-binding SARP family transcriptional activator